jgi:hypothetical protein
MLKRSFKNRFLNSIWHQYKGLCFLKKDQNYCTLMHAESLKPWRTYSGALPLIPSIGPFKTPTPLIETLFPGIVLLNRIRLT